VEPGADATEHLVLPDGCEDIVFLSASGTVAAVGTMTRAKKHIAAANQVACGVRFRPSMARSFLGIPAHELTDAILDPAALWGSCGTHLRQRIIAAGSVREIIRLMAGGLPPIAGAHRPDKVQTMMCHVVEHGGRVPLADMARYAGLSQRQLRRAFLQQTGVPPKLFCRILRFRGLVKQLVSGGRARWPELALDHGYYDQSHLINEFHALSGLTPTEYASGR